LAPPAWLAEQYRLARTLGFLEATLAALRAQVGPGGQRKVLLEELPALTMPTLILWGARDRVFPRHQDAAARLREKHLLAGAHGSWLGRFRMSRRGYNGTGHEEGKTWPKNRG
jgi:pimeloyl-ACP methyl ester carboxylesterase